MNRSTRAETCRCAGRVAARPRVCFPGANDLCESLLRAEPLLGAVVDRQSILLGRVSVGEVYNSCVIFVFNSVFHTCAAIILQECNNNNRNNGDSDDNNDDCSSTTRAGTARINEGDFLLIYLCNRTKERHNTT